MLFKYHGEIAANTASTAENWEKLHIAKGTIVQWIVQMPEECADLLQFRVEYRGTQLLPFTRGEYAYGLFIPTTIPDKIKIDQPPYVLDIFSFNDDDRHDHEFNLYVNVETLEPVEIGSDEYESLWSKLKGFIGVE